MNAKPFYPILTHAIVCLCWYVLNDLFFIGPEPGRLTQYVYSFINQELAMIMMITVAIIGLGFTFIIYFKVGRQIQTNGTYKIISLISIAVINILVLLAILIYTHKASSVVYVSILTLNAPFFILHAIFRLESIWSSIVISTFPSALMLLGYLYQAHIQCK